MEIETNREKINCNFCGTDNYKLKFSVDGFNIVKCNNCSLIFNENPVASKDMNKLYDEKYFNINDEENKVRGFDESNAPKDRLKMLQTLKNQGKLLEIGCGTGAFLRLVKNKYDSYGIDVSKAAAEFGRERFGLNIKIGVLEDNEFSDGYFDVVVMWHLLEHLPKPFDSLKEVNRLLKRGGVIGLEVPNVNGILWRFSKGKWKGGLHPKYHRYHFSVKTLTNMLNASGFEIKLITTNWENFIHENSDKSLTGKNKNLARNSLNYLHLGPIIRIFAIKIK